MAIKAIKINPRDFQAWSLFESNPQISPADKANAILKLKELDPFNLNLGD